MVAMKRFFPGRYRPGLIEARSAPGLARSAAPPFRGVIAPASLKRAAPAFGAAMRPGFPGRYRPGLIEAGDQFERLAEVRRLSGALSPRPH